MAEWDRWPPEELLGSDASTPRSGEQDHDQSALVVILFVVAPLMAVWFGIGVLIGWLLWSR